MLIAAFAALTALALPVPTCRADLLRAQPVAATAETRTVAAHAPRLRAGAAHEPEPTRVDSPVMEGAADSLGLELVLPRSVRAGEPVAVKLRVQNLSQGRVDLYLRGRTVTMDVIIARPDGEVVWRRLENEIIPAIVHVRTLAPEEQLEVDAEWDQRTQQGRRVEAGEYTARGLLLVEGAPLETSAVPFRILDR